MAKNRRPRSMLAPGRSRDDLASGHSQPTRFSWQHIGILCEIGLKAMEKSDTWTDSALYHFVTSCNLLGPKMQSGLMIVKEPNE